MSDKANNIQRKQQSLLQGFDLYFEYNDSIGNAKKQLRSRTQD